MPLPLLQLLSSAKCMMSVVQGKSVQVVAPLKPLTHQVSWQGREDEGHVTHHVTRGRLEREEEGVWSARGRGKPAGRREERDRSQR